MTKQPYQYQRRELAEPDWRRLPGWAGVTPAEWESAQWQRAHSVKNLRQLRDVTGGFRAYRRRTLEELDLTEVHSQGYCFQIDLAWRAVNRGATVVEVPITFVERELGVSKMSGAIVVEAIWRVTCWGFAKRFGVLGGARGRGPAKVGAGRSH